jgi:hypothetical protein
MGTCHEGREVQELSQKNRQPDAARVSSAYRTASTEALEVIAGFRPTRG